MIRRITLATTAAALLLSTTTLGIARPLAPVMKSPESTYQPAQTGKLATRTPLPADEFTGRVLIKAKSGVSSASVRGHGASLGYDVDRVIPRLGWIVATPSSPADTPAALASRIRSSGIADKAVPETVMTADHTPADPLFGSQWGFKNTGQWGGVAGRDSSATPAWDWSRGEGVVVAVVDTGVDVSRPDLAQRAWVNTDEMAGNGIDDDGNGYIDDTGGWDFYRYDSTPFDARDGDKHGTHVAGTIAASSDNGQGGTGMAPRATIMPVKFLGPAGGGEAAGADAIVYAVDNGADVINASWGSTTASPLIADAIAYAAQHDVLVVCAAGNDGANTDLTPDYPASYPATNIVSVAALDNTGALASYSNRGAVSVDIAAPGSDILSTQPALSASLYVNTATSRIVYHAYPVESAIGSATRSRIVSESLSVLASSTASPILLVDDSYRNVYSEGSWRLDRFTAALTAAGYTNITTWRTDLSGTPSAATMSGKTVVWFTGAASFFTSGYGATGTLNSADRTALQSFLSNGGRLLMSSGDLGCDMHYAGSTTRTWYATYFHARLADDDPWTGTIHGARASQPGGPMPLFDLEATVADPLRYSDGCDDVAAADSYATSLVSWDDYAVISGTSMAAPHVAGTVALMLARTPEASAQQLKDRLLGAVRVDPALAGKTATGGALDAAAATGVLGAPASFVADAGIGEVSLAWTDATDADFDTTRVLAKTGGVPASPTDPSAAVIYEGSAGQFTHSSLAADVAVGYAAYSRNMLGSWSAAATATATPVAPLSSDDRFAARWNTTATVSAPGVLHNDRVTGAVPTLVGQPDHGTVELSADGAFSYRPDAGFYGTDVFDYRVSDGRLSQVSRVTLDVWRYRLDSLSSSQAAVGSTVILGGTGFGAEQSTSYVTFGGVRALISSWSDTRIEAIVPPAVKPGYVGVRRDGVSTNGLWFKPVPRVASVSADRGAPGTVVTLAGSGFGVSQGSGWVSFAGTTATVLSWSDTSITAIVPAGASSGYVGVLQNGVMSNGTYFVPFAAPRITATNLKSGAPGTAVTFTGTGFGTTQAQGFVTFAGIKATVVSWSDTQVVAIVPLGAVSGYAGVSAHGLMSNGVWFVPNAGPRIESLSAVTAPTASPVTISGSGFGTSQGTGFVTFAGTKATVISWSDTQVVALVPLGAPAGYVGVYQGGIMSNGKYFVPTPQ